MSERTFSLPKTASIAAVVLVIVFGVIASFNGVGGESMSVIVNRYDNPFMPSGFTFMIWWVIYSFLGMYAVFEMVHTTNPRFAKEDSKIGDKLAWLHLLTAVLNVIWLFLFAHSEFAASFSIIVILFAALRWMAHDLTMTTVSVTISNRSTWLPGAHLFDLDTAFDVYATWVGYATILNLITLVEHEGGRDQYFVPSVGIVLLTAFVISTVANYFRHAWWNSFMNAWLALGIINHGYENGPDEARPFYVAIMIVSVVGFVIGIAHLLMHRAGIYPSENRRESMRVPSSDDIE